MSEFAANVDGKSYDFGALVPLYGASAIQMLATAWGQQFVGSTQSVSSLRFRDFTRFLKWIAARAEIAPNSVESEFFRGVQSCQRSHLTREVVYGAGEEWAARLRDRECFEVASTTNLLSRKSLLDSVTLCLRKFARSDLWADPGKFQPVARGQLAGGNIPSFGELAKVSEPQETRGWVRPSYENLDWREVIQLNEKRLAALRAICVRDLKAGLAKWERGQLIVADATLPTPESPTDLLDQLQALGLRRVTFSDQELQRRRGHAAALMIRYLALKEPHRRSFVDWRNVPLADVSKEAGGWLEALQHLEGNARSLLAAQTIVMIDTGFNVTTCDRLAADPFLGNVRRGKVRIITIAAAKLRARGELQEGHLLEGGDVDVRRLDGELSGAEAIRIWQKISSRIRFTAQELGISDAEHLWIVAGSKSDRDRIAPLTGAAVDHHWHAMLAENFGDPIIGGLPIRRQMIRPTVLQLESSRGNFEYTVAARLAQHKQSATTMRYLSRPWFRALLASKMRTYLKAFEASIAAPISGAPDSLGTIEAHMENLDHAIDTGLGFLCAAPREAPTARTQATECTAVDLCATCSFRQFRPAPESIRALVLFQRSIAAQEENFRAANPARWAEVWIDFQALCEVIVERLRASHHRPSLAKAEVEIDQGLAAGTIEKVQLW